MTVAECPEPCALPIIFVPGIMGSRLRRTGGRLVWDPDNGIDWNPFAESEGSLAANALSGARTKRENLVGRPGQPHRSGYLQVDRGRPDGNLTQDRIDRGWGGLHQSSYFQFMMWLDVVAEQPSTAGTDVPARCHALKYEAFAHPYNWTDDNRNSGRDLARTVADAVRRTTEKWASRPEVRILKPVLVTHSMGGLVARAYTQIHGGAGDVQGVIHGAMPTDGAPATYKRMLAGFEGAARFVLGSDQAQVTATAGNMPGALQLLPTSRHKSVNRSSQWLRLIKRDGSLRRAYPSSDAYSEIYSRPPPIWWRLIHERYLDPEGDPTGRSARAQSMRQIAKARQFDQQLGSNGFHPNTRMFYSDDDGHLAWDKVEWRQTARNDVVQSGQDFDNNRRGRMQWGQWTRPIPTAFGVTPPQFIADTRYEIQPADAPGDATVHAGSGRHVRGPMSVASRRGFEHQYAYNERTVRTLVAGWLFDLVMEQL